MGGCLSPEQTFILYNGFWEWANERRRKINEDDCNPGDKVSLRTSTGGPYFAGTISHALAENTLTSSSSRATYDGGIVTVEKHKYYDESFLGRKTELSGLKPSEVEDDDDEEKTEENGWTTSHLFCHIECGQRYQPATTGYGVVRLRGDGQLDDDPGSADGDREGNANVAMIAKDDAADGSE